MVPRSKKRGIPDKSCLYGLLMFMWSVWALYRAEHPQASEWSTKQGKSESPLAAQGVGLRSILRRPSSLRSLSSPLAMAGTNVVSSKLLSTALLQIDMEVDRGILYVCVYMYMCIFSPSF